MSDSRERFQEWAWKYFVVTNAFAREAWDKAYAAGRADGEAETARRCAELAEKLAIHYRDVYKNRVPSDDQAYHPHTDGLSDGAAQVEEAIKYVFPEAFK